MMKDDEVQGQGIRVNNEYQILKTQYRNITTDNGPLTTDKLK
jgi:hypothetical protein